MVKRGAVERYGKPVSTEQVKQLVEAVPPGMPLPQPKKKAKVKIKSIIPLPIIGQHPYIEFGNGITPGLEPFYETIFEEPEPEEAIVYPSPILPIEPKIGEDFPQERREVIERTIYTPIPLLPEIKFPDYPDIKFPDFPDIFGGLKDIGKYALIGGALILGALFLSRR